MTAKLNAKNNVVTQPVNTMAGCFKQQVPNHLTHVLDALYPKALKATNKMLKNRNKKSSADYPEIPCVVSKSLVAKYQRNKKCKEVHNLSIIICGDKGKQVKLEEKGIRVPALFKKNVIPVVFPWQFTGYILQVEFFKRNGKWLMSICCNRLKDKIIDYSGVVGVDRNSVGNVAVMADIQTGKVFKLGIDPAGTKKVMRGRRGNLQSARKFNLLAKIKRKQSRRMTHENHKASKTIVDYAALHRRAIVLEELSSVRSNGSKIKKYSEKNQWAYAQLGTFIEYKAALRGVPIIYINPAYTSQRCSRCGSIHKPNGKRFRCLTCGHVEHRDANAAFNIGRQGAKVVRASSSGILSVIPLGLNGNPYAEKKELQHAF
jgi:putative transposase